MTSRLTLAPSRCFSLKLQWSFLPRYQTITNTTAKKCTISSPSKCQLRAPLIDQNRMRVCGSLVQAVQTVWEMEAWAAFNETRLNGSKTRVIKYRWVIPGAQTESPSCIMPFKSTCNWLTTTLFMGRNAICQTAKVLIRVFFLKSSRRERSNGSLPVATTAPTSGVPTLALTFPTDARQASLRTVPSSLREALEYLICLSIKKLEKWL